MLTFVSGMNMMSIYNFKELTMNVDGIDEALKKVREKQGPALEKVLEGMVSEFAFKRKTF